MLRYFIVITFGVFYTSQAQTITDKSGYIINVNDYQEVTIVIDKKVKVTGDGYDDIFIANGATIIDVNKKITEKAVVFSQKPAFWKAFMGRQGFVLTENKSEKKTISSKADELLSKLSKNRNVLILTFNKQ